MVGESSGKVMVQKRRTERAPYFYANAHEKDFVPLKPAEVAIADARGARDFKAWLGEHFEDDRAELFRQLESVRWDMDRDIPWDKFESFYTENL